ncbi:thioredoxin domain-containing protein [Clostridium sp.]|uniref:thioredoxin domain-containing protein n=1 Tax=Clostridium sp. TaxID=1506 RepID=UPI0026352A16|nr:thioredoxin domain-containing protein [Clostridium sp.]
MKKYNHLINEKSPYLLQHAENPVNWYPWGSEAFAKAIEEDKPIFLSIGYSTCHWCHVMAHESFEDEEVAELLNDNFIAIKVDREERPDIDNIYMTVCQNMTGRGGWPLNVILTPEGEPFYAGTYFPKYSKYDMPGMIDLLKQINDEWKFNKDRAINLGKEVKESLDTIYSYKTSGVQLNKTLLDSCFNQIREDYEPNYGGFSKSPKFPTPHKIMFLLRYYKITGNDEALDMVNKTLESMYRGGIFDHIGFGFSRYSTDNQWLAPHFEKMLYDNALLTIAYLEAYEVTKNNLYKKVAEDVIEYVFRELLSEEGGFYSAEDADSEGEEGKYYIFNPLEVEEVLGREDGFYYNYYYGITPSGNFEGKNILNLINKSYCDFFDEKIKELNIKMLKYRKSRMNLHKDDKILTSWNGLMIAALGKAYKITLKEKYLKVADKAVEFIYNNLIDNEGRLLARYRDKEGNYLGYLDDYAFLTYGLIELYESSFDVKYLEKAVKLNEDMINKFKDNKDGAFFMTMEEGEELITRPKEFYDGAIPSGNSVAAYNILRLSKITGDSKLEDLGYENLKEVSKRLHGGAVNYSFFLSAVAFDINKSKELIVVLKDKKDLKELKEKVKDKETFNLTIVVKDEENKNRLKNIIEYINEYKLKDNETTYYLCENKTCNKAENNLNKMKINDY